MNKAGRLFAIGVIVGSLSGLLLGSILALLLGEKGIRAAQRLMRRLIPKEEHVDFEYLAQ